MFNFADYLISQGVPAETLYLILMLPFLGLIVGFLRYFVGIKTFGVYEPVVLAYALYAISPYFWIGLKFGLPLIILAFLAGEITKRVLKSVQLHFMTKISIKIGLVSILYIGILLLAARFNNNGYFTVNPLSFVIIITMLEAVSLFRIKVGNFKANIVGLGTFTMAILSYAVLSAQGVKTFILLYPWVILATVFVNFMIGRYQGLQVTEYVRFKSVIKDD